MLAETGGTATDKTGPQKGGACRCWASPRGDGWSYIQKVNKVSVTVLNNYGNGGKNFTRTMPCDKFSGVMTAAEVAEKKATGALIETEDGTGFYIAEKPTTPRVSISPDREHLTRPRHRKRKGRKTAPLSVRPSRPCGKR